MKASIIIRTLNEEKYLGELLKKISQQKTDHEHETIIVDSGSNDDTLEIAKKFNCRIVHIEKSDFSFGRSLNFGCRVSEGKVLVFISGHCVPTDENWLQALVQPILEGKVAYTYGKQIGDEHSRFSERQLFSKYFPEFSQVPQRGFYCNNANAALLKSAWEKVPFDEELTGLEDMYLAKQLVQSGGLIGYVAESCVYHHHDETWRSVRRRYEREAIALQYIMPEIHLSIADVARYFASAVLLDAGAAIQQKIFWRTIGEICTFRLMQFWGAYKGNHDHRKLSKKQKEEYFYPKNFEVKKNEQTKGGRAIALESK